MRVRISSVNMLLQPIMVMEVRLMLLALRRLSKPATEVVYSEYKTHCCSFDFLAIFHSIYLKVQIFDWVSFHQNNSSESCNTFSLLTQTNICRQKSIIHTTFKISLNCCQKRFDFHWSSFLRSFNTLESESLDLSTPGREGVEVLGGYSLVNYINLLPERRQSRHDFPLAANLQTNRILRLRELSLITSQSE